MEKEKAQLMFKLAFSKKNWGAKYQKNLEIGFLDARSSSQTLRHDRLEHFKRFENLEIIVKELNKIGWLLITKKPNYIGISLNTQYKKEIINFIETHIPEIKGWIK
ncbi:MAG: hypothetical protein AABX95_03080 [Nanoarchaeota archaeon]